MHWFTGLDCVAVSLLLHVCEGISGIMGSLRYGSWTEWMKAWGFHFPGKIISIICGKVFALVSNICYNKD